MKKLLALCLTLVLMLSCLTACDTFNSIFGGKSGVGKEYYENCAVFSFDDFESRICITLDRTGLGEGTIYYQVNLEEGALSVKYSDVGLVNENQLLSEFTADDEMPINGSGGYIEGDKIAITFEAFSSVKGEIIIAFTEDALKAIHKDIQLHEHTREMRSNEYAHWYVYTCGCETPENSAKHSDIDENYICDGCDYVMPGHEHTSQMRSNEYAHWYVYICGCETPENSAKHGDIDGDFICDDCGYELSE